jgi:hypothetical protein
LGNIIQYDKKQNVQHGTIINICTRRYKNAISKVNINVKALIIDKPKQIININVVMVELSLNHLTPSEVA